MSHRDPHFDHAEHCICGCGACQKNDGSCVCEECPCTRPASRPITGVG